MQIKKTNNTIQASWVAIGALSSFGFSIVSSMILSRYFLKDDYGTYKQVLYVYNTLLTVFTLGLPRAFSYFLPRVDLDQAKSLIKKITNIFFVLGLIFSVSLFVLSDYIALILKNPDLAYSLKIFSPVPFLMLPTMGLEGILATYRKTKLVALYTIVTRVLMLVCIVTPVLFFDGGYVQALIGFVLASFVSFIIAIYLKYYPVKSNGNASVDISYIEIFKFSLPLLFASLWGILISSTDQFFISRYFGNEVFAEFSNGSLELPFVGMIVGATSVVLSPIFSKMSHQELNPKQEIFPLWRSVLDKTTLLIYPLVIYTWFFADIIMLFLYGEQYEVSSVYFRIKSVVNFFTLIAYAPLIINIGKVKQYATIHMYGAFILIFLEYISVLVFNSPYAIVVVSVICQIGRIYFMLNMVAKFFSMNIINLFPIKLIAKILLPSILILSIEYYFLTVYYNISNILILLISFGVYLTLYLIYAVIIKLDYISIIKPLLIKINK